MGPGQVKINSWSGDSLLESLVETSRLLNFVSTLEPTKPTSKLPCQYTLKVKADLQNCPTFATIILV